MKFDKKEALEAILGPEPKAGASKADALALLADELIEAVNKKDSASVAQALRSSFLQLDSEPQSVEGEHIGE